MRRVVADSALEGGGFEPSVPLGREVLERSNKPPRRAVLFHGDRGFESGSLQERGINKTIAARKAQTRSGSRLCPLALPVALQGRYIALEQGRISDRSGEFHQTNTV